jgi:hypothetical protein
VKYSVAHGSPYDRGGADSYYGGPEAIPTPHYYLGGSIHRIDADQMSKEEIDAYYAGFNNNLAQRNFKLWD